MDDTRLYTASEIADMLKIKKNTVYELIKRGELKASKIGKQIRVSETDYKEYIGANSPHVEIADTTMPLTSTDISDTDNSIVICGQDQILDILCSHMEMRDSSIHTLRSYMGSYNSLNALYNEKVHVATSHLWDGITNEYNIPYIHHLIPGTEVVIVHLIKRMQGFYVKSGNPKGILSFKDLTRNNVRLANREKGSGTRVLLDEHLLLNRIHTNDIAGYNNELKSHMACAGAVAMGSADVALGSEHALYQYPSLDFIPIQTESYDLVYLKKYEKQNAYKVLLETIRSKEFKEQLTCMKHYDTTGLGKILI